jgi:hypothetical protein
MRVLTWIRCALIAMGIGSFPAVAGENAHAHPADAAQVHRDGIWKAAVPASGMHAEFNRFDAYGLAVGARIPADCSLNWINPDDGLRYCFASGTSLVYFLDAPNANIASARATWKTMLDEQR